MGVKLDLEINDVISDMDEFKKEVQKRVAEAVLEKAQFKVPVDTGHLKSTGEIVDDKTVRYTADYAIYVHEIPGHSTGYKWLERAWKEVDVEAIAREVMAETMMGGL